MTYYYRFELYQYGKPIGEGFIRGLANLMIDEGLEERMLNMFHELHLPCYLDFHEETKAYFTLDGKQRFAKAIKTFCDFYEKNGTYEVVEHIKSFTEDDFLYEDEDQIIVKV